MAGGAEKKRAANAIQQRTRYTQIITGIYVYNVVCVLYQWSSLTRWSWSGFALIASVNYAMLTTIFNALEYGTPYDWQQDVLFVNWFVQVTSVFSSWFWLAYLSIPAYLFYQYGFGLVKNWWSAPPQQEDALDAREAKRVAKKERQAARAAKFQR